MTINLDREELNQEHYRSGRPPRQLARLQRQLRRLNVVTMTHGALGGGTNASISDCLHSSLAPKKLARADGDDAGVTTQDPHSLGWRRLRRCTRQCAFLPTISLPYRNDAAIDDAGHQQGRNWGPQAGSGNVLVWPGAGALNPSG